jgi:hypothetical protein
VRSRSLAAAALLVLLGGAVALLVVELARGALDAGALAVRDPCVHRPPYPGSGFDATIERIVLDGLDGAACELRTSREELVLSLASDGPIRWDDATIERALRSGLLGAIDDAEQRGTLNGIVAALLRRLVERAPVQWLIDGGQGIAGLFG